MWVAIIISLFVGIFGKDLWKFLFFENNLIVRLSKMAVRTLDGMQVLKKWNRRRLEEWEDDVRWNVEEDPPLVVHPKVEAPPKHEREGLSYSKAWQRQYWDDYGRVAGEDVTLEECERKQAIICRNIGGFQSSDYFRVYSRLRYSTTGSRRNSGCGLGGTVSVWEGGGEHGSRLV